MQKIFLILFLFFITSHRNGNAQELSSLSIPTPFICGVNLITGQPDTSDLTCIHYENYCEGWNHLEKDSILLEKGDFRIGRVKTIDFTSSDPYPTVVHLSYEPEATHVETEERLSIYRYSELNILMAIEHYQKETSGSIHLDRTERLVWQEAEPDPRLVSHVWEDENGQAEESIHYFYSDRGLLVQEDFYDGNGYLRYDVRFHYDDRDQLISMIDGRGEFVLLEEDSSNLEWAQQINSLTTYGSDLIETITNVFFNCFRTLQLSAQQAKINLNAELRLPSSISQGLEKFAIALLGESNYRLFGPHFEETVVDCYGQHEINDKVRVTFINGILNTRNAMHETLEMISGSHGDVNVHYVYRPTEGWTWDISRGIMIKTAFSYGFRSTHAYLLAQMWRSLIEEMGGVAGGGTIMHYAHSLGGAETDRARDLLTPEEQKMIRVITFGSATVIRNEGFKSVINIVSVNDGVCLLDPIGRIRNFFDPDSNVRFYGSVINSPCFPLSDHVLNGHTYGPLLIEFGNQFLEEFRERSEDGSSVVLEPLQ